MRSWEGRWFAAALACAGVAILGIALRTATPARTGPAGPDARVESADAAAAPSLAGGATIDDAATRAVAGASSAAGRVALAGPAPAGRIVRGTVRSGAAPVPGAEVVLTAAGASARAITDANGSFEVAWTGLHRVDATVAERDHLPARRAGVDVSRPLEFELARASTWVFHVVNARSSDGAISLWRQMPGDSRRWEPVDVSEDAPGRFLARGLAPGDYAWQARFGDGVAPLRQGVRIAVGEERREAVTLVAGATLVVRARDEFGDPVADARTTVSSDDEGRPAGPRAALARDGATDARGELELAGLEPGTWSIELTAPTGARVRQRVQLQEGARRLVELTVPAAVMVRGRVLDTAGAPVAGATVAFAGREDGRRVVSDEAGRFVLGGLPGGARHRITARPPPDETRALGSAWAEAPAVGGSIDIVLPFIADLVGRVEDANGVAIAGARIVATAQGRGASSRAGTTSESDGSFRVAGISHGRVRVVVQADGHIDATVEVQHRGDAPIPTFRLDRAARVRGVAVTDTGHAPDGVSVRLFSAAPGAGTERRRSAGQVDCDEFGRFEFAALAGGDYEIDVVSLEWMLLERPQVRAAPGAVVDLVLELFPRHVPGRAIVRGHAIEKATGAPAQSLRLEGLRGGTLVRRGTEFERSGVAPGRAVVAVGAPGLRAQSLGTIELIAGAEHDLGTIALEPGLTVFVEVVDEAGNAQTSDVRVELVPRDANEGGPEPAAPRLRLARRQDRFATTEAAPGRWRVVVQHPRRANASRQVTLPLDAPVRIEWGAERP